MPEGTDESSEFTTNMSHLVRIQSDRVRILLYIIFISLMLAISVATAASAYPITATVVGNGSIEPSGTVTVKPGENFPPFWITPESGYHRLMTIDGKVIAGFQGFTFINVNSDHTLSFTFVQDTGSLDIRSYPFGAIIYIDGINVGLTPKIVEVPTGTHELQLVLAGYNDYSTTVTVKNGKTTKVDRILAQQIPTSTTTTPVSVRSTPSGASVYLEETNMGTTPLTIPSVSYGAHTLILTYPGYQDSSNQVDVSETTNAYEYTLTPIGQLSFAAPVYIAEPNPNPTIGTSPQNNPVNVLGNIIRFGIEPPAGLPPSRVIIFLFIVLIPLILLLFHDNLGIGHLSFYQPPAIRVGIAIGQVVCGIGLIFVLSTMISLIPEFGPIGLLILITLMLVAYLIFSALALAIGSLLSRPLRWTMRVHVVMGMITLIVTLILLYLFAKDEVMASLVTIMAAPVSALLAFWQDHSLVFNHRQMSTPSPFPGFQKIQKFDMPAAGEDTKSHTNTWEKTNEQQFYNELEDEYGFPPATCRSLVQLMHEFVEDNYGNLRNDIHIIYHAVRNDEPPEKPLDRLQLIPVLLTISQPDDADILRSQGVSGLRKHKLQRMSKEAYDHGGQFVLEDLALLLTTSIRTIQCDIKELREQGIEIHTRGSTKDIGPTVSHKTKIIELYLKGYEYAEIEQLTCHTSDSIEQYLSEFSKVILLSQKNYTLSQIRELTSQSDKVVSEYLVLYETYKEIGKDRIAQILNPSATEFDTKKGDPEVDY